MKNKRFYLTWDMEIVRVCGPVGYDADRFMIHVWIGPLWLSYVRRPR